jgi:triacylglycerol lipase
MGVDSALAMGTRGALRALLATALALIVLLVSPAVAGATTYPVRDDFSQGLIAQGVSPDSPPPGANGWSCRPSSAHPRPVVLVHGLLANQTDNWQTISPLLANRGYCVFSLTYGTTANVSFPGYQPGGLATMEDSAHELAGFVDRVRSATGASHVDIVGHSEGSLMPDYYVKFLGGDSAVRHYVGITTLWHGTNLAGLATIDQIGAAFGLSSAAEQTVSTFLRLLPRVPRRVRVHQEAARRRHRGPGRQVDEHRHPQRRAGRPVHERHRGRPEHD